MPSEDFFHNFAIGALSGSIGGCAGLLFGFPFDTIRVNMQTKAQPTSYRQMMSELYVKGGIRGLYSGLLAPMSGECICNFLLFGVFHSLDNFMEKYRRSGAPLGSYSVLKDYAAIAGSGGIAGVCMAVYVAPSELIKIQLQTGGIEPIKGGMKQIGTNDSFFRAMVAENNHAIRQIVRKHGFTKLFHGFCATLMREIPFNGIYFLVYELTKRMLSDDRETLRIRDFLTAGFLAGVVAWALTYPTDFNKTVVQSNFSQNSRRVFREYPIRSMFKGMGLTLLRAGPVNAVTFCAVEMSAKLLRGDVF